MWSDPTPNLHPSPKPKPKPNPNPNQNLNPSPTLNPSPNPTPNQVLNDFMGRVAHAPYTAAAASALGALLARELARALAPPRKVICL